MDATTFKQYITAADFTRLFIEELGWNKPKPDNIAIEADDRQWDIIPTATLSGFQILKCQCPDIPGTAICRKLDTRLRRLAADYILIFTAEGDDIHHKWICPVKDNVKRDIIAVEYKDAGSAEFLRQKMDILTFPLDQPEPTIIAVREKVATAFRANAEKVTKAFYTEFRKQHDRFATFITGLNDTDRQCYTSVMLNRLMFCYFIQKKGFLDSNTNYLPDKLLQVRTLLGPGHYHSFYRSFLCLLFRERLAKPERDTSFDKLFGRIPYLNGGMFAPHTIEQQNKDIDIKDEAFEALFQFFGRWQWHLDTRLTATGQDINPDVLGYIFEQYINDRAAMGAYYTKEDITEYIAKNTILPFLLDRLTGIGEKALQTEGELWTRLADNPTEYIYKAVQHGFTGGKWKERLPQHIACGLQDITGGRTHWNEPADPEMGLPTEIWRETIERLTRCQQTIDKIKNKQANNTASLIALNLDIRQLTEDTLRNTKDHLLIKHFYTQLHSITILDPTCGSGAFLFAALGILEPLYEVCIDRMQEFHGQNNKLFTDELKEIEGKYKSNIQHFIYKTIILRNIYGVDIMREATEIAKLRLFLKMVAVVDANPTAPNLGLDPLPDIDFNIRTGNTLVGYANEAELESDLTWGDMFANMEYRDKIQDMLHKVADAYETFRKQQLEQQDDHKEYIEAKQQLRTRLTTLNAWLNKKQYDTAMLGLGPAKQLSRDDWEREHQPFNWIAEYYDIIHNGGFDVVIGNPPYVEYNKRDKKTGKAIADYYTLRGYSTITCDNLYAFVLERTKAITKEKTYTGMIVPLSGHSTKRMAPLVNNYYNTFSLRLIYNLSADANPSKLFEGVKFRLAVFIVSNAHKGHYSTKYTRWYAAERDNLFTSIVKYNEEEGYEYNPTGLKNGNTTSVIGKISSPLLISIAKKINGDRLFFFNLGPYECRYHDAPVNWMRSHTFKPYFISERDGEMLSKHLKAMKFRTEAEALCGIAVINSTLFFIWWITHSSCYNVNSPEITSFRLTIDEKLIQELATLGKALEQDLIKHSRRRVYYYKTSGRVEYDEFYMKLSKPILDRIDTVLASHYGFTSEELDYILNYDIKYRMGDEL